jgi:hypothetical protein
MQTAESGHVMAVRDLREYFHGALQHALAHQHVDVEAQTEHYVVNLLTLFARSEQLFDTDAEGLRLPSLVQLLSAALAAPTRELHDRRLQRLGDISLFIAGFFAHSFARKLVDIDYHIRMGGQAYGTLGQSLARGHRRVLGRVFCELAEKFLPVVDALGEVADSGRRYSEADVLRLYEVWLKTGSPRAATLLRQLGVEPAPVGLAAQ